MKKLSRKPMVTSHLRLAKARAVEWKKPQTVIMGSSTAETGLDPEHPDWINKPVYNLGLSGANIYEVMRYLQHAQSIKPLKTVVLTVNFFMFNAYSKNRVDFSEEILNIDFNGNLNPKSTTAYFSTLLTYDAINASLFTIKNQDKKNAFKNNGQLVHNYRNDLVNQLKGYRNNFISAERYNRSSFLPPPANKYAFYDLKNNIDTMNYMKKIIEICETNNTELVIIIAPEHVRLLETYKLLGLWEQYEQWQSKLVSLVNYHNMNHPNLQYALWSFNNINQFTTEPLPVKDDHVTKMQWFWDPLHFKNEFGNLILSSILNPQFKSNIINFRSDLTKANLSSEFEKIRSDLNRWESLNSDQTQEIKQILSSSN
ncbi:hypothetical protein I5282_02590 [Legionella sp. 30cs62]|uniref:Uncharacterized protein n=2 Tax=Legionella bononiensis TaxID=2793102 RepID=A0ABS1W7X3_9GAMM|nr:hypothetical protein [Legionella bononiensis]